LPRPLLLTLTDQPTRRIRLRLTFSLPTCFRNGHPSQPSPSRKRQGWMSVSAEEYNVSELAMFGDEAYLETANPKPRGLDEA